MGYTTVQNDTWDKIAKKVYDDESYTSLLMENNKELLDYFVFPAGVEINVVDIPEEKDEMPEWRD